jgi:hypothetical protein
MSAKRSSSMPDNSFDPMDEAITIELVPDSDAFGRLRSYDGNVLASAVHKSCVNYKVYCPIRIHGRAKFEGKDYDASLLVFSLRSSAMNKRRIKTISLELEFAPLGASPPSNSCPRILNSAPDEQKILRECTVEDQEHTASTEMGAGASGGASGGSAQANINKKDEKKVAKQVKFSAEVWGSAYPANDEVDYSSIICWSAEENSSQEHGVPPVIRLPVLLLRPVKGNFICKIKVEETLHWNNPFSEWWYKITKWSNQKPRIWTIDVGQSRQGDESIEASELEKYLKDNLMKELVRIDMPLTWEEYRANGPG